MTVCEWMLAWNTNVDDGNDVAVAHPQSRRPCSYAIKWTIVVRRRSCCLRLLISLLTWPVNYPLETTHQIAQWIGACVYLFTHASDQPGLRDERLALFLRLYIAGIIGCRSWLLYIHSWTGSAPLFRLFVGSSAIAMKWLSLSSTCHLLPSIRVSVQLVTPC